jgi:hypothetical protein
MRPNRSPLAGWPLVLLFWLSALTRTFALQPFEVIGDPEKQRAETKAQDTAIRAKIDFPALLRFVQDYAKHRGKVVVGEPGDRYETDLARALPSDAWKLTDEFHNRYVSGNWYWHLAGEEIAASFFDDHSVLVQIRIKVFSKKRFELTEEQVEDRRYILDG